MYWDPEAETLPRPALEALQYERLREQLSRVYNQVPLYHERFHQAGITPADIHSLADLRLLPCSSKVDFRDSYPLGLLAVPRRDVVRLHASSGTTGKPTVVAYTSTDLDTWRNLCARQLTAAGVTADDIVQVAMTYGLFTGGMGWHYAAERLGAMVLPASSGNSKRQIMLIQDLGTTVFCCTPSYAIYLAEEAESMGVNLATTSLRIGIHGAEPWSEEMRRAITQRLGLEPFDTYGLSEVIGPGVAAECQ
ncbi:MAG: phenylacetate--CoA ligase family protein, partial [Anaerolineae bacterium]